MFQTRNSKLNFFILTFLLAILMCSYTNAFLYVKPEIIAHETFSQQNLSPNSSQYNDYELYGIYIEAPTYYQANIGETDAEQRKLYFTPHNTIGGAFDKYQILIDDTAYVAEPYYSGWQIVYSLPNFIFLNKGVYTVTCIVHHNEIDKYFNASTLVNITENSPRLQRYYPNFYHSQWNGLSLDWTVYMPSYGIYFNYSLYINNDVFQSQSDILYEYGYYIPAYIPNGYFDFSNKILQFKLIVLDELGRIAINRFNVTVASANSPIIDNFRAIPEYNIRFSLWETQNVNLSVIAHDDDGDLDKIYIYANWYPQPIAILEHIQNYIAYQTPIDQYALDKMMSNGNFYELRFRVVAVDKSGKASQYSPELYLNIINKGNLPQLSSINDTIEKGKFIGVMENHYNFDSSLNFKLNIIATVKSTVSFKIYLLNAEDWQNNVQDQWFYHRGENSGKTFATWRYQSNDRYAGCVFWVLVSNYSAIQWPILVKITYPADINPDPNLNEPTLQFLERRDSGSDASWYAYRNENLTTTPPRDERISQIEVNAVEVNLYNFGMFAFGRDQALYDDYNTQEGFYISGYNLGCAIVILAASSIVLLIRSSNRIRSP